AHHRVADLGRHRVADAPRGVVAACQHFHEEQPPATLLTAPADQELRTLQESLRTSPDGCAHRLAGSGQGIVSAQALSRLRPRLRRAATTPRPPLVAMRARKPCRRLRTSLEGW